MVNTFQKTPKISVNLKAQKCNTSKILQERLKGKFLRPWLLKTFLSFQLKKKLNVKSVIEKALFFNDQFAFAPPFSFFITAVINFL